MTTAALALVVAIKVGELVSYTHTGTQQTICARVASLDLAAGDVPAAWIVNAGDAPRGMVHVQLVDLRPGCARP